MAISAPYTNGAVLTNTGAIQVTSQSKVENLNAEKLQNETPASFVKTSSATSGASGISQEGSNLSLNNEIVQFTGANSKIKIGNIIIKSSNNGNGILIGIE